MSIRINHKSLNILIKKLFCIMIIFFLCPIYVALSKVKIGYKGPSDPSISLPNNNCFMAGEGCTDGDLFNTDITITATDVPLNKTLPLLRDGQWKVSLTIEPNTNINIDTSYKSGSMISATSSTRKILKATPKKQSITFNPYNALFSSSPLLLASCLANDTDNAGACGIVTDQNLDYESPDDLQNMISEQKKCGYDWLSSSCTDVLSGYDKDIDACKNISTICGNSQPCEKFCAVSNSDNVVVQYLCTQYCKTDQSFGEHSECSDHCATFYGKGNDNKYSINACTNECRNCKSSKIDALMQEELPEKCTEQALKDYRKDYNISCKEPCPRNWTNQNSKCIPPSNCKFDFSYELIDRTKINVLTTDGVSCQNINYQGLDYDTCDSEIIALNITDGNMDVTLSDEVNSRLLAQRITYSDSTVTDSSGVYLINSKKNSDADIYSFDVSNILSDDGGSKLLNEGCDNCTINIWGDKRAYTIIDVSNLQGIKCKLTFPDVEHDCTHDVVKLITVPKDMLGESQLLFTFNPLDSGKDISHAWNSILIGPGPQYTPQGIPFPVTLHQDKNTFSISLHNLFLFGRQQRQSCYEQGNCTMRLSYSYQEKCGKIGIGKCSSAADCLGCPDLNKKQCVDSETPRILFKANGAGSSAEGICGQVCRTIDARGGTCQVGQCIEAYCGIGYVCTADTDRHVFDPYCTRSCPDGIDGNICKDDSSNCTSDNNCDNKTYCDAGGSKACVQNCEFNNNISSIDCTTDSQCHDKTNCPQNTICDTESDESKCVPGCPDGTPGTSCVDYGCGTICSGVDSDRNICDSSSGACLSKCPNEDPRHGSCSYESGKDVTIGSSDYYILSVSGAGAGCQATVVEKSVIGNDILDSATKVCKTTGYRGRLPSIEELQKIASSIDTAWSLEINGGDSAFVVTSDTSFLMNKDLEAQFFCVQTIIGTGSDVTKLGARCTDNDACHSQTTTCGKRNLCFNGQCVDPNGILVPPVSGGGNLQIIINEYGFSPYPDMDYNSLMSKYPMLGRICSDTTPSTASYSICGNGFTCRAGIYDPEAGMDDTEKRCFFNICNNSSTDSEHCINLQKINWKDAISDNDTSRKEYLSKSNQYRNNWSGFESNQELAYKMHLLNSLPPSPAQTYKSSIYNLNKYVGCVADGDCLNQKSCDTEKNRCECENDTDCTAGGFCDTDLFCAKKSCLSGINDLTNTDLVYEAQDINCYFCIAADLVEHCGNYSCSNDSDCASYGACNKCDTYLAGGGVCVSTIPVCAVAENNWKQQVEKSVGEDLQFNEQGEVVKYKVIKGNSSSDYHVVSRENNSNVLNKLSSPLSAEIINVEARLREIKSVVKAWGQWYGLCKNPEKMNPKTVLWETDDSAWNPGDSAMLNKYQEITGGNLQINCLTDDPVPAPGTVFLDQAKNLNLPGLLDQTNTKFLNSTEANILPSRGWYDAKYIFEYYLSRCGMEKSALADVLSCFENITNIEELNYCKYCSSGLFPFSCESEAKRNRDRFYYGVYVNPRGTTINTATIRQKIRGYKAIDLCMNPTVLYHIVGNSTINSGSVVNVTPQSLPLVSDSNTDINPVFCTDEYGKFLPGCIVCTDISENSNCLTNLNCNDGYQLIMDSAKNKMCLPLPAPVSDKKTIFQYLLNWGG